MGTLDLHEQGRQILLTWVFYYDELPPSPVLPDGSGRAVSLRDPGEIKESLGKLAEASFQLKLGGQIVRPSRISQLLALPDKTCLVVLNYPAPLAGQLEMQAPILGLLPVNYLINVRILNADGKTTSLLMDRNSPPVIASVKGDVAADQPAQNPFWSAFAAEIGTAWIHTDWILLVILLVLSYPLRKTVLLVGTIVTLKAALVHLQLAAGMRLFWQIPLFPLCLPILLLCWFVTRRALHASLLVAAAAGLLLILYDVQFLPAGGKEQVLRNSLGYSSGFAAGLILGLALILVMNTELEKFLRFHPEWRTRVCWAVGGTSLWISIYSLVG